MIYKYILKSYLHAINSKRIEVCCSQIFSLRQRSQSILWMLSEMRSFMSGHICLASKTRSNSWSVYSRKSEHQEYCRARRPAINNKCTPYLFRRSITLFNDGWYWAKVLLFIHRGYFLIIFVSTSSLSKNKAKYTKNWFLSSFAICPEIYRSQRRQWPHSAEGHQTHWQLIAWMV